MRLVNDQKLQNPVINLAFLPITLFQQYALGFTPVDKKSNEITAIPEVLDVLFLEGALITSNAKGCQKNICKKIIDKKADFLLCAKDNQPTLSSNIEAYFSKYEEHLDDP